ncbi:MAG: GNAT family N-acetyltransferase, partial [Anaerolineae bacterium]|nr:GNAT family N-acetyltransferase [Anaerolineae bacterium]
YQVHTHLDWQDVSDWLNSDQGILRLAWSGKQLIGVLGVSTPLYRTAWIRLAALHDRTPGQMILDALWRDIQNDLKSLDIETISVLATRTWIERYIDALGFQYDEEIITLRRDGDALPALRSSDVQIRVYAPADLQAVTAVDHLAFSPPWQLSSEELRLAAGIASSYTVAIANAQIIGYQVCTLYRDGAHLARLAVHPGYQGRGIGSVLLNDVLRRFFKRRVYTMTVNTQVSNHRSQHLYQHYGFERNGYDLPVWSIRL